MFIYEIIYGKQLADVIQRVNVFERDSLFIFRESFTV